MSKILQLNKMIKEEDLIFVTTTLYTKWFTYQQKILKKNFP